MHPLRQPSPRDERGQALSSLLAVVVMALFLVTGLVVDGGAKVAAARAAESAAAHAARAGVDAGAVSRASGAALDLAAVRSGAQAVLADRGVQGSVAIEAGVVRVSTRTSARTVFLSILGINELAATGEATASLER